MGPPTRLHRSSAARAARHTRAAPGPTVASPRPVTATGMPWSSSSSARGAGANTRAATDRAPSPATRACRCRIGHAGRASSPHGTQRTRSAGRPTATRHRGDHRVVSEQALQPGEDAVGAVPGRGIAAPEPELTTVGRHTSSGTSRTSVSPPVVKPSSSIVPFAVSQPSSCQRTRSTSAAAVSAPS